MMRYRWRWLRHLMVMMIPVLALASCTTDAADSALRAATVDTLPGGVIRVVNHGPTEWADSTGWRLELERVISSADSGPALLASPHDVVATSAGEIMILDRQPALIKVFSADGEFVRTIGREGAGPGEYADFGDLAIIADTLVVNDRRHARMVLFDVDGTYLRSFPGTRGPMWRVTTTDGRIQLDTDLAQLDGTPNDNWAGSGVRRLRTDGSVADSFFYPPEPRGRNWSLVDATHDLGTSIPFMPDREKTLNPAGQLIWGDQGVYRLVVTSNGRDTVRVIESTAPAAPISDSLRRAELADVIKDSPWAEGIASLDEIPKTYPAWTGLHSDAAGNLWVLRPGPSGPGAVLDVFAPDGRLRGSLTSPFDTFESSYWTADRIYRIGRGEDDLPQIEVWRVVR